MQLNLSVLRNPITLTHMYMKLLIYSIQITAVYVKTAVSAVEEMYIAVRKTVCPHIILLAFNFTRIMLFVSLLTK